MEYQGFVLKVSKHTAIIGAQKKPECGSCKGCRAGKAAFKLRAVNSVGAKTGDLVLVKAGGANPVLSSLAAYAFPTVFSLIGLFIGSLIGGELFSLLFFTIFLALSFAVLAAADKALSKRADFAPKIVKIIKSE